MLGTLKKKVCRNEVQAILYLNKEYALEQKQTIKAKGIIY